MPAKTRPEPGDTWAGARLYAERGWAIFPLLPRKKYPRVQWRKVATSEAGRINQWFADVEPSPNVGLACGESGLLVIDPDTKAGIDGRAAWERIKWEHGFSDAGAFLAATPSGGRHVIFTDPTEGRIRNSTGALAPGIDVRGNGGYIVAPPSIHPDYLNGPRYRWLHYREDVPPAPAPEALVELLLARPARTKSETSPRSQAHADIADCLEEVIPEGRRNSTLTRFGGKLRHAGFSFDEITETLLAGNASRCRPHLPPGEVRAIARSVSNYPAGPVRVDRRLIKAEFGEETILLAALLAAEIADEDLASVANVSERTMRRWWRLLREAGLEDMARTRPSRRYCTVPRGLLHDTDLRKGEKVTAVVLAIYMTDGQAMVGLEQLLRRRGIASRDKLSGHIDRLEMAGHLLVSRAKYCGLKGRRGRPNVYRWRDTDCAL